MERREFITLLGGAVASPFVCPLAVRAQGKIWRLGFLTLGAAESKNPGSVRQTTLQVLADRGFSEGRNLVYVSAGANGNLMRLPELAKMLVKQRVDVIIAVGTPAARAPQISRFNAPLRHGWSPPP